MKNHITKDNRQITGRDLCMCEIIVVTSGKGGVGKTTTTANLGAGLAMMRKKVLMIDTDIGLRNLTLSWGLRIESFIIWLTLWKETAESNRQ